MNWKISVTKFWKSNFWIDSFVAFSVGYVVEYSIFSVDAVFMEKFATQNRLFWHFSKNQKNADFVRQITTPRMHSQNFFCFHLIAFFVATSCYTSFALEVQSSWRNLLNKIVRFQDFSPELFEDTFCQKFWKQTILFCKLLLLYGTYRKIGVYHDIANRKSYKIETKRNFRVAF